MQQLGGAPPDAHSVSAASQEDKGTQTSQPRQPDQWFRSHRAQGWPVATSSSFECASHSKDRYE